VNADEFIAGVRQLVEQFDDRPTGSQETPDGKGPTAIAVAAYLFQHPDLLGTRCGNTVCAAVTGRRADKLWALRQFETALGYRENASSRPAGTHGLGTTRRRRVSVDREGA
jgi:hypothetical protein